MLNKKFIPQALAVVGLAAAAGGAQAVINVYTSQASFLAAVLNPATDTFMEGLGEGIDLGRLYRRVGVVPYEYDYEAVTSPNRRFYRAGTPANPWLSTDTATDVIVFGLFSDGVGALGGNFFGSNQAGAFAQADIRVTATDADGTVTQTIVGATASSFLGFVSTTGVLRSATVASIQTGGATLLWPTVDNLVLAAAAAVPVPEPGTYGLLLGGLGVVGFMASRRRAD